MAIVWHLALYNTSSCLNQILEIMLDFVRFSQTEVLLQVATNNCSLKDPAVMLGQLLSV